MVRVQVLMDTIVAVKIERVMAFLKIKKERVSEELNY